jgi:hypothetical protein
LTDDELIDGFEAVTLASFHHRDHVRVAWIYLRRLGLLEALAAVSRGLQRMAAAHGQQAKYHETVSWLYVFVIHERMAAGDHATWDEFERSNPDLLAHWGAFVGRYYSPRALRSPVARRSFVLPDRLESALTRR